MWDDVRAQQLADNIRKDINLLKGFEDKLRYESNPRDIENYKQEIKRQQESIACHQIEYDKIMESAQSIIESYSIPEKELQDTLNTVQLTISEIRQGNAEQYSPYLAKEVEKVSEIVNDPKFNSKHKLKYSIPIIPLILSYEGELKSVLNFKNAWKRLITIIDAPISRNLNFTDRKDILLKPEEEEKDESEFDFNPKIKHCRQKFNSRKTNTKRIKNTDLNWEDFCLSIEILAAEIHEFTPDGGFSPDIVFGISNGGIIVADLIYRKRAKIPVLSLWADRHSQQPESSFSENEINSSILEILKQKQTDNKKILIFDDISRTGNTLLKAKRFLEEGLKEIDNKIIKTATLVVVKEAKPEPDYWIIKASKSDFSLPYSSLEIG